VLLMLGQSAPAFGDAVLKIMLQLLLPLCWASWRGAGWTATGIVLKHVDQTSIYLVAFSSAVVEGLWSQLPLQQILCWPWPAACCWLWCWADLVAGPPPGL
jgi:sodium/bile acid cotransporter 7